MVDPPTQPLKTWRRNRELLKAAFAAVIAEGRVEPGQLRFLATLCNQLAIDVEEVAAAVERGEKTSPELLREGDEEERLGVLRVIVGAALSNGGLCERDRASLIRLGSALHLPTATIELCVPEVPTDPAKTDPSPCREPRVGDPIARAREILKAAALVTHADFKVVDAESAFIVRLAIKLGIPIAEAQRIGNSPGTVLPELLAGCSEKERNEAFEVLVGAAMADHVLHSRERVLLQNLARAMGMAAGLLDDWTEHGPPKE